MLNHLSNLHHVYRKRPRESNVVSQVHEPQVLASLSDPEQVPPTLATKPAPIPKTMPDTSDTSDDLPIALRKGKRTFDILDDLPIALAQVIMLGDNLLFESTN